MSRQPRRRMYGRRPRSRLVSCTVSLLALAQGPGLDPAAADERENEVIEALLDDRYQDAFEGAARAVEVGGATASALALLGVTEVKIGRYEAGEGLLRRALQRDPDSPEAHLGLGILAYARNNLPEAERLLLTATRSWSLYDEAYHLLRAAFLEQGDLGGAKRTVEAHQRRLAEMGEELPPRLIAAREQLALCASQRVARIAPGPSPITVELVGTDDPQGGRMIPLRINGQGSFLFHLDSAYRHMLALSPELADHLTLRRAGSFEIRGVGRSAPRSEGAWLDTVQIGELMIRDVPVLIIDSAAYRGRNRGLVGTGLLKRFNCTIDVREGVLELFDRSRPELFRRRIEESRVAARMPFFVYYAPLVRAQVGGGEPLPFLLDTGASATILDAAYFQRHLRPRIPEGELAESVVKGAGGVEQTVCWLNGTVQMGGLTFPRMRLISFDMHRLNVLSSRYAAGVLSRSVLWPYRCHFDFSRPELILERHP